MALAAGRWPGRVAELVVVEVAVTVATVVTATDSFPVGECRGVAPLRVWEDERPMPPVSSSDPFEPSDLPPAPPAGWRPAGAERRLVRCDPHPAGVADRGDGRLHLGELERVVWRQWDAEQPAPSRSLVESLTLLAELPAAVTQRLTEAVGRIFIGPGSIVDLDHLGHLRGSGAGRPPGTTWDMVAGVYWSALGVIAIGDIPSRSAAVSLHEAGHVLTEADRLLETTELTALHAYCRDVLPDRLYAASVDEFAAESFARSMLADRTPLISLVGGNQARALAVRLYWVRQYGER